MVDIILNNTVYEGIDGLILPTADGNTATFYLEGGQSKVTYVNFTQENGEYTCDMPISQIAEKFSDGEIIYGKFEEEESEILGITIFSLVYVAATENGNFIEVDFVHAMNNDFLSKLLSFNGTSTNGVDNWYYNDELLIDKTTPN